MPYRKFSTVALAPAEPGWTVTVEDLQDGEPPNCPIVAWASVVVAVDPVDGSTTELHPVFVAHGSLWTGPEYPVGGAPVINAPGLVP
ncbi:hypothetical protein ACIQVK_03695 [Streptomyces sp. NPDC090493]|uniref:hypothetical protein n=1 Tax=Streptomyces sp. NPDC090493 TaxID=3365964 RepID=UPI00380760EB